MTIFPVPQWSLKPDSFGVRPYGNVNNSLEVVTREGSHHVALAVPTGLFTLMRFLGVPREEEVKLLLVEEIELDAITKEQRTFYVLSILFGEDGLYDLFRYTSSTVPKWVFDDEYKV